MKNSKLYIALFTSLILGLSSCKNDLDVLAPGEEAVSVYGILNPNETVQNIRINKVYITDGDALALGQNQDQINYEAGVLKVSLERYVDGALVSVNNPTSMVTPTNPTDMEVVLTETVVTTNSGTFNQSQRIWQTNKKMLLYRNPSTKVVDKKTEYKLVIKNTQTGSEFSSINVLVDSVKTLSSSATMPFIYNPGNPTQYPNHGQYITNGIPGTNTPDNRYIDYTAMAGEQKIKFKSVANAKLYNVIMRFHYKDYLSNGDSILQYADKEFPTIKSSGLLGDEPLEMVFPTINFYENIASEISKKTPSNLLYRKADYMEYIIYAGAESLNEFLQINAPSNSIAQDKPYYTNITNGVGIFSSKSKSFVTKDLLAFFIDKIACHPLTNPLLFKNSLGATTSSCP